MSGARVSTCYLCGGPRTAGGATRLCGPCYKSPGGRWALANDPTVRLEPAGRKRTSRWKQKPRRRAGARPTSYGDETGTLLAFPQVAAGTDPGPSGRDRPTT